jgi:hypothetical protein
LAIAATTAATSRINTAAPTIRATAGNEQHGGDKQHDKRDDAHDVNPPVVASRAGDVRSAGPRCG